MQLIFGAVMRRFLPVDLQRQCHESPNHEALMVAESLAALGREVSSLGQELLNDNPCLEARQRGTDTQMDPPAKTEVMARIRPTKVHIIRLCAQGFATIRSRPKKDQSRACR
jgi:hypothetical protein